MEQAAYIQTLNELSEGFCRLKGIGALANDLIPQEQLAIHFQEWEWEVGVGLYGFWHFAKHANDEKLLSALSDWYERQLSKPLPEPQINSTAPMLTLVMLAEHYQRNDWLKRAEQWADWLVANLPRTEAGGFQHVVKERPNNGQLWDDTLFMTGLFLAKVGQVLNRTDLIEEAEYQFLVHAQYLAHTPTGLWYHGWTFEGRHNFAGALWARGNAWITVAIPEFLTLVSDELSGSVKRHLSALLEAQINALIKLQAKDGMWHTLLNDPTSPVESSATAGIAYGLLKAWRMGIAGDAAKEAGLTAARAVLDQVENGILLKASDGTAMGHDLQYYCDIKDTPVPYGQALAMMMVTELIQGGWSIQKN